MAKILDFNAISTPVLPLIMCDDKKTHIDVVLPSESLISEFLSTAREIQSVANDDDTEVLARLYDLIARLISSNQNGITVTVDDLIGRYRMTLQMMIAFIRAYTSFITEIANEKN